MPAVIRCLVAPLFDPLPVPPTPFRLASVVPESYFDVNSQGDIDLRVRYRSTAISNVPAFATSMFDLHGALRTLTGNPVNVTSVDTIGVLIADTFRDHPGTFGVMFDRGFRFDPDAFGSVPREGCAVFLRPIALARTTLTAYRQEVVFTMMHELGHVFNLLHVSNPINLMSRSGPALHPPPYAFVPPHQTLLRHCSSSRFIHPGGSEFGDRGPFGVVVAADPTNAPAKFGLALRIEPSRSEFWYFEPVELDVTVYVRRGVERTFTISDAVDPGYPSFVIWIEEPDGERRRYHSPKQFCGTGETLTIAPEVPFRRDISIFGESRGYTFRKAGVHHLWATMELDDGTVIQSERVPVNLLPVDDSSTYRARARVLEPRAPSQLLYYRRGTRSAVDALTEFAEERSHDVVAAEIHYAVGRALIADARLRRTRGSAKVSQATLAARVKSLRATPLPSRGVEGKLPPAAREHLKRAQDHPRLSTHRREIVDDLLARV